MFVSCAHTYSWISRHSFQSSIIRKLVLTTIATKSEKLSEKREFLLANKDRVYILDGTAMLFKAYYAGLAFKKHVGKYKTAYSINVHSQDNELITQVSNHFRKFLSAVQPCHLAVVFDHGKKTFRNELYPE